MKPSPQESRQSFLLNAVATTLKAESRYGPKTAVYYIEFRVRRHRGKGHLETQTFSHFASRFELQGRP